MGFETNLLIYTPHDVVFRENLTGQEVLDGHDEVSAAKPIVATCTYWELVGILRLGRTTRGEKLTNYPHITFGWRETAAIGAMDRIFRSGVLQECLDNGWVVPPYGYDENTRHEMRLGPEHNQMAFAQAKMLHSDLVYPPPDRPVAIPTVETMLLHNRFWDLPVLERLKALKRHAIINTTPLLWTKPGRVVQALQEIWDSPDDPVTRKLLACPKAAQHIKAWQGYLQPLDELDARVAFDFDYRTRIPSLA